MVIWTVLIIIALAALIVLATMIYDSRRFVLKKYQLTCPGLKREYRFVMLSDLHNKQFGENNEKLLAAIGELKPESILIAGDMLTSEPIPRGYDVCGSSGGKKSAGRRSIDSERSVRPAMEFVSALAARYPVYYANGNHEYRLKTEPEDYLGDFQAYQDCLLKKGVVFLENSSTLLPGAGVRIWGLDMERDFYRKFRRKSLETDYMASHLGRPEPGVCNILLAHNPDYFPEYAAWGADVVLSGHVHGGIMKLPLIGGVIAPSYRLFPRYDGGLFQQGRSRMILGRGLGSHTIPIRVFNPGELIEVCLIPE